MKILASLLIVFMLVTCFAPSVSACGGNCGSCPSGGGSDCGGGNDNDHDDAERCSVNGSDDSQDGNSGGCGGYNGGGCNGEQ